jgi:hypothetical protein
VVCYLFAAVVALMFLVGSTIFALLAVVAFSEDKGAPGAVILAMSGLTGYVSIRMLGMLRRNFVSWRRRILADRAIPRATIVSR